MIQINHHARQQQMNKMKRTVRSGASSLSIGDKVTNGIIQDNMKTCRSAQQSSYSFKDLKAWDAQTSNRKTANYRTY